MAGRGRWGANSAVPSVEQAGIGERARRSLRRGWGSRGFVSSVGVEPLLNGIPLLCPAVSHPAVESASLGYANSGCYNLEESAALLERWKTISVPRGQDHKVLLLPEGSEALRAGAGE